MGGGRLVWEVGSEGRLWGGEVGVGGREVGVWGGEVGVGGREVGV